MGIEPAAKARLIVTAQKILAALAAEVKDSRESPE